MQTDEFAVGETVSSQGIIGVGITFEVIELLDDGSLKVKLTKVSPRWAEKGFAVGQERIMERKDFLNRQCWAFQEPVPAQFFLTIVNERKVFML